MDLPAQSPLVSRRHLLRAGSAVAGTLIVGARSHRAVAQPAIGRLRGGEILPIPDFTKLDRVPYRVGIRPHRRTGVRLDVDPVSMRTVRGSPKFLVHNYGHGGAGITLSFGCAEAVRLLIGDLMEREIRRPARNVRVAVIGAGVIGLTTAAELKRWRPELDVRVMAKSIAANGQVNLQATTSWIAGGQFEPSGIWHEYKATATTPDRLPIIHDYVRRSANRIKALKRLGVQRDYGIVDRNNYTLQDYSSRQMLLMEDGFERGTPPDVIPAPTLGTLPFAPLCNVPGREYLTWLINPTILLPKLVADLRAARVRFERRDIANEDELRAVDADIVVNCTGLGAKDMLLDTQMVPIRGQLVILQNPRQLKYMFSGGCGNEVAYLFARQTDIVVGGTYEVGVDTPEIDRRQCDEFLDRVRRIFNGEITACSLSNAGGTCTRV